METVVPTNRPVVQAPPKRPQSPAGTIMLGVLFTIILFALSRPLQTIQGYSWIGSILLTPFLIVLTIPILKRQADREGDPTLRRFLILALLVKFLGAIIRYRITLDLYGRGDALTYDQNGAALAHNFLHGNFDLHAIPNLYRSGTYFISVVTGGAYSLFGPSIVAGYIFFSWLGFLGLLFFYRAFTVAVPHGRRRTYARLLFFLPSFVFWPSSIGKESWMTLVLGMAALGAAYIYTNRVGKGLVLVGAGLGLAANPRPHVAGLMAVGLVVGYVFKRYVPGQRRLGIVTKILATAALGVIAFLLVSRAAQFVTTSVNADSGGLNSVLQGVQARTATGHSEFSTNLFSPTGAPLAFFTVLYRPTIVDARSVQALLAALESTSILVYSLWRIKWMFRALRNARRTPYVLFSFVYVITMVVAFSTISNLGILTRERIQIMPLYLVLFMIPPPGWKERKDRVAETQIIRGRIPAGGGAQ